MVYTPESLMAEKQLTPRQIIDMKGLMGMQVTITLEYVESVRKQL